MDGDGIAPRLRLDRYFVRRQVGVDQAGIGAGDERFEELVCVCVAQRDAVLFYEASRLDAPLLINTTYRLPLPPW
jgi:hypothetical protein